MRKKYLSALLFGALLFASAGTFTSCKDYDDEIENLQGQVNTIKSDLDGLKETIAGLDGVKTLTYEGNKLVIETGKGTKVEVDVPTATEVNGVTNVKLVDNVLIVDGKEMGKVELPEGTALKVEVKDGKLYINDEEQALEVGDKVVMVDNGNSYTMTVGGKSYELSKHLAANGITSVKFEDNNTNFQTTGNGDESSIVWSVAATDKADWKGTRDTDGVKRNDLLVGQITTVNVQVTPAEFNLGAEELFLKDSKGNKAPVYVKAVANDRLLTRSGNSGSWLLSIEMNETITAENIAKAFKTKDGEKTKLYALCVGDTPVSNYDIAIDVASAANKGRVDLSSNAVKVSLTFVDEEGLVKTLGDNVELPVGEFTFGINAIDSNNKNYAGQIYDSYITFENSNKSLAAAMGIEANGMTIKAPAKAAGTEITATVHVIDIQGEVSKQTVTFTVEASKAETIKATETVYTVMPAKITSENKAEAIKAIEIDVKSAIAELDAATLQKIKNMNQLSIVEEEDQTGFLIASDNKGVLNIAGNAEWSMDNGKSWSAEYDTDDLVDLAKIKLVFGDNNFKIAKDAKPGKYVLYLVGKVDEGDIKNKEIFRIKMPVEVALPTFDKLFAKNDANWTDGKFNARITPVDNTDANVKWGDEDASITLSTAFKKVADTNADFAQLGFAFQTMTVEGDKVYPVKDLNDAYNDESLNAISGKAGAAILNKKAMYNKERNKLATSEIADMVAYTSVLAGLQKAQAEAQADITAIQEAFTVHSEAYTTKVTTALDGVAPVYYVGGKAQDLSSYAIELGSDNVLTPLSWTDKGALDNGFGFVLNGDYVSAKAGTNKAFAAEGALDGYTVQIDGKFTGTKSVTTTMLSSVASEGQIDWNNANYVVSQLNTNETATLTFTFEDATGIEYPVQVTVKKK